MYSIVEEQTASFNGLGAGGETFSNITNALTNAANSVATVTNSFANLKNAKNQSNTTGGGTQTVVYVPPTTNTDTGSNTGTTKTESKKGFSDYLPWIIGGAVLIGGLLIMNNNKGRR